MIVQSFAPAKINLYLHVAAPRADGYHPLQSLVMFAADAGDVVSAEAGDDLTLAIAGPLAAELSSEPDNLILKAARLLAEHGGVRPAAALRLVKNLPIASGIGGGSADAAAALRVLNALWRLGAADADLEVVAQRIGADVPACVTSRTALMEGVGDRLSSRSAPTLHAVLVNPGVLSPTGAVYRAFDGRAVFSDLSPAPDAPPTREAFVHWLAGLRNDLEAPALACVPAIATALDALREAAPSALVRMSGSGATCFGLLSGGEVGASALALRRAHPDWWVCATSLGNALCPVQEVPTQS